jgi:DNA-binding response OmpR family regulator
MRVLLVEDDARVAAALEMALARRGFQTLRAGTATEALAAPAVDLVLLDLGLPDRDGIQVCRELRRRGSVAIIAVTARNDERDRVAGLRSGADDYIVKPFGLAELEARIDAVMRRAGPVETLRQPITIGSLVVDPDSRMVTVNDAEIALTHKEYELLIALVRRSGMVVTREQLMTQVWQSTWTGNLHTIDVHLASLRSKLGDPTLIQTVRGVGYRMRVEQQYRDSG